MGECSLQVFLYLGNILVVDNLLNFNVCLLLDSRRILLL